MSNFLYIIFSTILISTTITTSLYGVDISTTATAKNEVAGSLNSAEHSSEIFGHNLFNGSFSNSKNHRYNPSYLINIGDTVTVRLWGAVDFQAALIVDAQGNLFLPKIGIVSVLGVKNSELSQLIESEIKKVYKQSVYVYADLQNYQPVSIFVTGSVNKPGLYEGLSNDSVIQFIDKASGIDSGYGSYRNITILRENKVIKNVDLYTFLFSGSLDLFQFQMGDVIMINSIDSYIEVLGDVKRPYRFELVEQSIDLNSIIKVVLPNPTATNIMITHWDNKNQKSIKIYAMNSIDEVRVLKGDSIEFLPDHNLQTIEVKIEGEHNGLHNFALKKGTTLQSLLDSIKYSQFSDKASIQLFRKSVANTQKQLIETRLNDLESKVLTASSLTSEEAVIRQQESALVMNFIERARKVEPKGQVVINPTTDLNEVVLENHDTIFIPKKSRMIIVDGEVMLPGAQTYVKNFSFDDYITSVGGYGFRANEESVLIIHPNGKVLAYDDTSWFNNAPEIKPGDSILVLGKVDSKVLQVVKDITQIVYQIAVGAAVVIRPY